MQFVTHSRYSRKPKRTPVANFQKVILDAVREYEQSLPGIDEGWDEELLDDPFEFQQRLMESHEPHDYLVSQVEDRLQALDKAEDYIGYWEAASILGITWDELNQDIEDGHIPITRGSTVRADDLKLLLLRIIGR